MLNLYVEYVYKANGTEYKGEQRSLKRGRVATASKFFKKPKLLKRQGIMFPSSFTYIFPFNRRSSYRKITIFFCAHKVSRKYYLLKFLFTVQTMLNIFAVTTSTISIQHYIISYVLDRTVMFLSTTEYCTAVWCGLYTSGRADTAEKSNVGCTSASKGPNIDSSSPIILWLWLGSTLGQYITKFKIKLKIIN